MAGFKLGDRVRILELFPGEFKENGVKVDKGTIIEIDSCDEEGCCDEDGPVYLVKLDDGYTIDCDGDHTLAHI